jgi:serine/threonine protein kinase/Tfp pilus assembly protein PilF
MDEASIFLEALKNPSPDARAAFLDRVCGGNDELRRSVELLLRAHDKAGGFLADSPAPVGVTVDQPITECPGTVIGPYKLIEPIGEGGMGTVWMAQQQEPVRRFVAVKLIKAGMDSKQVVARFEAERQALALMDHANIAKVLDGGTTSAGRPYFVMDLVKGVPITRYCDEHHLTPRQRLELFVPVCQAIQHAHQKGIIHRDLKPSNVLIALYDGRPVPRVIDFGVAKATGQALTDKTLVTGFGAIVGTLEYMSPEQAEINQLDIDTRSDIYSLGVLLYELLAGSPPFCRKELEKVGVLEMLRVIREEEPSKPSTKLSTAEGLPTLAANRGTEPAKLTKLVRGELDWIVMKALEKNRNRRYDTANAFAADVQRYLHDEPVLACPPSAWYRCRKFARRHRGAVLAASLIVLTLLGGIVGTTIGLLHARASAEAERLARADAVAKKTEAEKAATSERTARQAEAAERQKAKAAEADSKAFAEFLDNHVLAATRPEGVQLGVGVNVTMAEALAKADPKIAEVFAGRPKAEALARHALGVTWRNLGHYPEAERDLEQALELRREALGPDDPDTLNTMNSLGLTHLAAGHLDRAVSLLEQAVAKYKAKLGPDDHGTLVSMNNLALAYQALGQVDKALPLFEDLLAKRQAKSGPDDPETLQTMNNLGSACYDARQLDKALSLWEQTLEKRKAKLGPDHPHTLESMNNLAAVYFASGQPAKALPLLEQTLEKRKAKLGPDHPHTLESMNNLANAYMKTRQLDKAVPLLEQTLEKMKAKVGPDHPDTLQSLDSLAHAYHDSGQKAKALPLFEQTLAMRKAKLGPAHFRTLQSLGQLGLAYVEAQCYAEAEPLLAQWVAQQRPKLPADDVNLGFHLMLLGDCQVQQEKHVEAEKTLREGLAIYQKKLPQATPRYNTESLLGAALAGQRKYVESEPLLLNGFKGFLAGADKLNAVGQQQQLAAVRRIIDLYDAWNRPEDAAPYRKRLEMLQKTGANP